jgi:hypothetical protein
LESQYKVFIKPIKVDDRCHWFCIFL